MSSVDETDVPTPGTVGSPWRQRAVNRSTEAARQRAANRVHRFLLAAREIIVEKGTADFTVQEVVDRSAQSLRSFYQYFDGKHELLLTLFEERVEGTLARVAQASADGDPLDRLEGAVVTLYDLCATDQMSAHPGFSEFAARLLVDHRDEVAAAYAPLVDYFTELVEDASAAGLLRRGQPRRQAAIVLQSATVASWRTGAGLPMTAQEVWKFCLHAIAPDEVAARRA
jgi:AcrR family transcriptional regulator